MTQQRSWADITRSRSKKPPDPRKKPQAFRTQSLTSTEEIKASIADQEKRTIIIRRADPDATVESIIDQIMAQVSEVLGHDDLLSASTQPFTILKQVTRDELDRRRFYITFLWDHHKKLFQEKGFKLGNTTIPPTPSDFQGFIQFPPYYLSREDLKLIVSQYGKVIKDQFVSHQSVRTGGWHFDMCLNEGAKVPDVIYLDGEPIHIINKSARKRCTWCQNYGHLQRQCQKRKAARLEHLNATATREEEPTISSSAPARVKAATTPKPTQTQFVPTQVSKAEKAKTAGKIKKAEKRPSKDEEQSQRQKVIHPPRPIPDTPTSPGQTDAEMSDDEESVSSQNIVSHTFPMDGERFEHFLQQYNLIRRSAKDRVGKDWSQLSGEYPGLTSNDLIVEIINQQSAQAFGQDYEPFMQEFHHRLDEPTTSEHEGYTEEETKQLEEARAETLLTHFPSMKWNDLTAEQRVHADKATEGRLQERMKKLYPRRYDAIQTLRRKLKTFE